MKLLKDKIASLIGKKKASDCSYENPIFVFYKYENCQWEVQRISKKEIRVWRRYYKDDKIDHKTIENIACYRKAILEDARENLDEYLKRTEGLW